MLTPPPIKLDLKLLQQFDATIKAKQTLAVQMYVPALLNALAWLEVSPRRECIARLSSHHYPSYIVRMQIEHPYSGGHGEAINAATSYALTNNLMVADDYDGGRGSTETAWRLTEAGRAYIKQ